MGGPGRPQVRSVHRHLSRGIQVTSPYHHRLYLDCSGCYPPHPRRTRPSQPTLHRLLPHRLRADIVAADTNSSECASSADQPCVMHRWSVWQPCQLWHQCRPECSFNGQPLSHHPHWNWGRSTPARRRPIPAHHPLHLFTDSLYYDLHLNLTYHPDRCWSEHLDVWLTGCNYLTWIRRHASLYLVSYLVEIRLSAELTSFELAPNPSP